MKPPTNKGKGKGFAGFEDKIKPFPNPHSWLHKQMRDPDYSRQIAATKESSRQSSRDFAEIMRQITKKGGAGAASTSGSIMNYGGGYTTPAAMPKTRVGVGGQASAV